MDKRNFRVGTKDQKDNLQVFTFTLTSELLNTLLDPNVSGITMKVDKFNKYHMVIETPEEVSKYDCTTISEKENTELYCLSNNSYKQVGNITHKLNVSTNVSKGMSRRIQEVTEIADRKDKRTMSIGKSKRGSNVSGRKQKPTMNNYNRRNIEPAQKSVKRPVPTRRIVNEEDSDESDSSEEQSSDSSDEGFSERNRLPPLEQEVEEEEEEVMENELIRGCRRYLETVKIDSLLSTDLAKKISSVSSPKSQVNIDSISNATEYYQSRSQFYEKYEVYEEIDRILAGNKNVFETLYDYYVKVPAGKPFGKLKERVEKTIKELHRTRKVEVKSLLDSFNLIHKDVAKLKRMIELYVDEERRKDRIRL